MSEDANPYSFVATEASANVTHSKHRFLLEGVAASLGYFDFLLLFAVLNDGAMVLGEIFVDPICWFLFGSLLIGHTATNILLQRFTTTMFWWHLIVTAIGTFASLSLLDAIDPPRPTFDSSFLQTALVPTLIIAVTISGTLLLSSAVLRGIAAFRSGRTTIEEPGVKSL